MYIIIIICIYAASYSRNVYALLNDKFDDVISIGTMLVRLTSEKI